MLDMFKRVIAFLLPVLRQTSLEVLSDVVNKAAYPDRHSRPRPRSSYYTSYNRIPPRPRKLSEKDAVLVAFDIVGPHPAIIQEWLHNQLPKPGTHDARGHDDETVQVVLNNWRIVKDNN